MGINTYWIDYPASINTNFAVYPLVTVFWRLSLWNHFKEDSLRRKQFL